MSDDLCSRALHSRLRAALPHLEAAIAEMRPGYDTYDGNARSLVHDLEYLRNRYASRIDAERLTKDGA